MAIPYPYTFESPTNLSTASYLNEKESEFFIQRNSSDLWYGFSEVDAIELSVYDLNGNFVNWGTLNTDKSYKTVTLSYLDDKDQKITYSYDELLTDFILYKNTKILVDPTDQLSSSFGIIQGNYTLSYNFTREMAGTPLDVLVVKDISPSGKEVKLIPLKGNSLRYQAFCLKKFQLKDVSPLTLQVIDQCPYDQIYTNVKSQYQNEINFLKSLMFLNTDGAFVNFLRTLYEDVIVYTTPTIATQPLEKVTREQGIRTYFTNYLLSNYETISDFQEMQKKFDEYTSNRVGRVFSQYGTQLSEQYVNAKKFLFNFFSLHFYGAITTPLNASFVEKYYAYFKNALNLGNNRLLFIVDHVFMDERSNPTDPLTLLVKLKDELPDDIKIQTECWVSNISITPYLVNVNVKNSAQLKTIKISSPNFAIETQNVSLYNTNLTYTAAELENESLVQQDIDVGKKINELNVDYSDFANFVLFSSAAMRTTLYKQKIITWTNLSGSLSTLNTTYSQSLVDSAPYQYYTSEKTSFETQMNEIVDSFDGYEAYLFNSGSYEYGYTSKAFVNASYVSDKDIEASGYDKANRDSLINNTPNHIVLDEGNTDYLTFLAMIGHYFDNLYLYIANLPSEKVVDNNPTHTFSKKIVDYMLESFGWKMDTTFEDYSIDNTYTTAISSSMSAEDRVKAVRSRILSSLPQIYKTKGTEEAIKLLLTCYGIPTRLLNIREYGGTDYSTESDLVYTQNERTPMFAFSGSQSEIFTYWLYTPYVRTSEFKIVIDNVELYPVQRKFRLMRQTQNYRPTGTNIIIPQEEFAVGFWKERGDVGRIYLEFGSGSTSLGKSTTMLSSSAIPIFDGNVYNVMVRRNAPSSSYESYPDEQHIPTQYDLIVQRNDCGRRVFRSVTSKVLGINDNRIWDGISADSGVTSLRTGYTYYSDSGEASKVNYKLGDMMVWDVPISDNDFEAHCNDFNSFAYSGSNPETHLLTRLDYEEPFDFVTEVIADDWVAGELDNQSEYYSTYSKRYYNVFKSGSWVGTYTGSIRPSGVSSTFVNFLGEFSGSVSGSLTGSGVGTITRNPGPTQVSKWVGWGSGSFTGSFSGSVLGHITQSNGTVYPPTASYLGIWTGQLTGSMTASLTGSSGQGVYISGSSGGTNFIVTMFSGSFVGAMTGSAIGYATGTFDGQFIQAWTGSATELYGLDPMPYNITYWNFLYSPYHVSYSYAASTCEYVTHSVYPYEFEIYELDKTLMTKKYGPNRYKNEKVKSKNQIVAARLDDKNRSTYSTGYEVAHDSNLLGLFLDPQDAKNRDIIKYLGNYDLMDVIGDPSNIFSASYDTLHRLNHQYNSFGNRKVYVNELITLYKLYFNRSVFEAIRNILPARTSARTGILVEPTILERPKYQSRPVGSEMNIGSVAYYDVTASRYAGDPLTKIMRFSGSQGNVSDGRLELLFGDFSLDTSLLPDFDVSSLPPNRTAIVNISYINEGNYSFPVNYGGGYVNDYLDDVQQAYFASIGGVQHFGFPGALGATYKYDFVPTSSTTEGVFLVKKWEKYSIYQKNGVRDRTSRKEDDVYSTSSIFLYRLVAMPYVGYNELFYTSNYQELSSSLATPTDQTAAQDIAGVIYYNHRINTGKKTPNSVLSDVKGTLDFSFGYATAVEPYYHFGGDSYYEVFSGYPRNHYTHKAMQFSPVRFYASVGKKKTISYEDFVKSRQTITSTIGEDGLEDGSLPVQTIETSNVNVEQGDNVINQ